MEILLSDEAKERMDGLTNMFAVVDIENAVKVIQKDLSEEGYEPDEITAYIQIKVAEALNAIA